MKNMTGKFDYRVIAIAGLVAGLCLLIEEESRRTEIVSLIIGKYLSNFFQVIFFIARLLPSVWAWMAKWKYVKSVPYGEVLLFGVAMATLMYT